MHGSADPEGPLWCGVREDGGAPTAARPELTELPPGLLQLLDLVLQHEHGHCERQQRQQLQLGRHHDSEQPHQTIHNHCWLSSCSEDQAEVLEEEVLEEETLSGGGGGSERGPVSAVCVAPRLSVRVWCV